MKRILLLMLLAISTMCFGCKSDKGKDPPIILPTDSTTYLDLENLWNMYYKDMQTVKDSLTAGTFVSERDFKLNDPKLIVLQVLTYQKNSPAGELKIECYFYKNMLIDIEVASKGVELPGELFAHYKAISEDVNNMTNNNASLFPYKASYYANVTNGIEIEGSQSEDFIFKEFQSVKNSRKEYLALMTQCIDNYKPVNDSRYRFSFTEKWREQMYDPAIGYPNGMENPDGIRKRITVEFLETPILKKFIYISISSMHSDQPYIDNPYDPDIDGPWPPIEEVRKFD